MGFLYALVPMALFLSFRVLEHRRYDHRRLFRPWARRSPSRMAAGGHPILAIPAAMAGGRLPPASSPHSCRLAWAFRPFWPGIVTNTGLYAVNLMAMGWKRQRRACWEAATIFTLLPADSGIGGRLV
ncbi:MAG: hypothetical protein ACLSHO_05915 [Dysosmobacter sp.]